MLQMLNNRVLVLADEAPNVSAGGIIIPESAKDKQQVGKVVAVGIGTYQDGQLIPMQVQVGDKILYGKYSGTEITYDNKDYLIMRDSDIFAIIPEEIKKS